MKGTKARFASIDEYISTFPRDRQKLLRQMRAVIRAAAPGATEKISYQMPAFSMNRTLVYFSGLKNHIGFYPTGSGIAAFTHELSEYETTPGAVKFPVDEPLPVKLIARIVKFRVAEDGKRATYKAAGTKSVKPRKSTAGKARS